MGRTSELRFSKRVGFNSTINGRRHYFGRDRKEAHKKFVETLNQHHKGELLANDTVAKLIDEYLFYKEKTVSEISYRWHERPLEAFKTYLGPKKKISTLGPADLELFMVQHWSKRLDGKRLSESTLQQCKRSVKSCFTWLVDNRKITYNPFRNIKVGKSVAAKKIPTSDQIEKVLKHFEHDTDLTDLIQFESITGCRVSEARSMLCEQVDLKNNKIELSEEQTKAYTRLKDKRLRTIVLSDDARKIVERNRAKNKTGYLFQNPNSANSKNQWKCEAIRMRFYRAKKHLGFYIVHRSLRHYFATQFLREGGSVAAGAAILGHANPTMLLTNYQKIYDDHEYLVKQACLVKPIGGSAAKTMSAGNS